MNIQIESAIDIVLKCVKCNSELDGYLSSRSSEDDNAYLLQIKPCRHCIGSAVVDYIETGKRKDLERK